MGAGVILIKSLVADYCSNSNRHQEKNMPEAVFLLHGQKAVKVNIGGAI